MHHSQTRHGHRYIPADQSYPIRNEILADEAHVSVYSEIFKHLFFPYNEYHRFTSNQHYQSRNGLTWLKRLSYDRVTADNINIAKIDIASITPSTAKFSAVYDTGDLGVNTPSLGIRLEQYNHNSSRARYGNNRHLDIVAEAKFPLYDIKSLAVRRIANDDYGRLDNGYMGQDPSQDDYTYEVTINLSSYGSGARRFSLSPHYRDRAQDSAARCLKDLHKHAESIKFFILGPRESWFRLKRLQAELGLRADVGNSTNTIFVGPENRNRRMGRRWGGSATGGRDMWNRSPSFEEEEDDDFVRGDWVNVRAERRYGYRDRYRDCDVDYVY
ncbi:hypothetical protein TWF970_000926 [Orbilia oligospora]|uniref:Uncharacterized protein n=1 Tax=Orbilia oligospora TaxID=2813651 RepID=A0A7C8RE96_ORBOL|nr:hypothetical protein TWF970_000926 [Orbilia oligospora]